MIRKLSLRNNLNINTARLSKTKEVGAVICKIGNRRYLGPIKKGKDKWGVDVPLNCGSGTVEGVWHTHPGGVAEPSDPDWDQAKQYNLKTMCITAVPGKTKCYNVN